MTIRQNIVQALRGETPEITPYLMYEWLLPDHETWQTPEWLELIDRGMGLTFHRETFRRTRHGLVVEEDERIENGSKVRYERWKTPVGTVQQSWQNDWQVEYFVKQPQDYKTLQWIIEHTEVTADPEPFYRQEELIGECGIVLASGWRSPAMIINVDWAGTQRFCEDIALEVPELMDLYSAMRVKFREETEITASGPGEFVKWLENLTVSMLGPRRYKSLLVSAYEECVPILERAGKRVMVHYDGALSAIKNHIAAAPFHMIESLTEPPEGDMAYDQCRAAWPDKVFWGNINLENYYLPRDEFAREIIAKRERAGKKAFAFELSEDLPLNWRESVPVVLETLEKLG